MDEDQPQSNGQQISHSPYSSLPQPQVGSTLPPTQNIIPGPQQSPVNQMAVGGKSFIVAWLLSFFFGSLGVDRYYLGYIGTGLLKMITLGGFGIWTFIDWILIISGKLKAKDGHELSGRSKFKTLSIVMVIIWFIFILPLSLFMFFTAVSTIQKQNIQQNNNNINLPKPAGVS